MLRKIQIFLFDTSLRVAFVSMFHCSVHQKVSCFAGNAALLSWVLMFQTEYLFFACVWNQCCTDDT